MKANELMIGGWCRRLIYQDTGREVVTDFQIAQIRKNGESLYVYSSKGNMGRVDQIEPIPLTAEILEKNFEKKTFYGIYDDYFDLDIREYSDSIYVATFHNCEMNTPDQQMTFSFVHELQHFLNHCGIEKEIEL